MLLTIDDLQTIVYVETVNQGLFLNSGPNPRALALQAIINDYRYCEALSPPDTVRMDVLLAFANEQY